MIADEGHGGNRGRSKSRAGWRTFGDPENAMPDRHSLHPDSLAAHAGCEVDPITRDVTPPIHFATTFERGADGSYPGGHVYSRTSNPTRDLFERTLAELEGGGACAAFASGMAAVTAVFQALRPGDHVVLPSDAYYGVYRAVRLILEPWGLQVTEVDLSNPESVENAMTDATRLVWMETPSNPLVSITDIRAITAAAAERGILTAVDSTWTTPLIQRPLDLGADLVVHSVTKYLAGHSDILGGAVVAKSADSPLFERIRTVQTSLGAVMDPFSCWLTLRGMRSLGARLDRQCSTALRLATFLESHPAVEQVHYPGLASNPGHEVAVRQMSRFGGMLSVRLRGGQDEALRVESAVRLFRRATSLGGTESLIEHRASVEAQPSRSPLNLLRISIGLEHPDDLQADLEAALGG